MAFTVAVVVVVAHDSAWYKLHCARSAVTATTLVVKAAALRATTATRPPLVMSTPTAKAMPFKPPATALSIGVADSTTETGWRVNLHGRRLPPLKGGGRLDPEFLNKLSAIHQHTKNNFCPNTV